MESKTQKNAIPAESQLQITPTSTVESAKRMHYMYGAVSQVELNGFLETNSINSEEEKRDIKIKWLQAAEVFQAITESEKGIVDTIEIKSLNADPETLDKVKNDPAFIKTFSNYPISFAEVEIDKIVAGQRVVDLDYLEKIKSEFKDLKDITLACLGSGVADTPVTIGRTAVNGFTLSSDNPGLRFLGAFQHPYESSFDQHHPGGQPVQIISLVLGYGISSINVYQVGKRLILNNGFHRLLALRQLGHTHAPVVVQKITQPELEMPDALHGLSRDYLISASRPALIKDFLNPDLNCEISQNNFLKSVGVQWGVQDNLIPR